MPSTSTGRILRRKAGSMPPIPPERTPKSHSLAKSEVGTDSPEVAGGDATDPRGKGGPSRPPGRIRSTIIDEMAKRRMTAYALAKAAREHCPTIRETAVGEFLKGRRSIGLDYLEAIMIALDLTIVGQEDRPDPS